LPPSVPEAVDALHEKVDAALIPST
jgi:hypothetical protein